MALFKINTGTREHEEFVFTKEMSDGHRHPQARMNSKAARRLVAPRYQEGLGRPCPAEFRSIRVPILSVPLGIA
jgi:hypothetical protein